MLTIKVLGPGCRNCETLARKTADALEAVAAEYPAADGATIEKVTDHNKYIDYGLMFTSGLVINEKLVSSGRVPTMSELKNWLVEALAHQPA
ncbi:MAG: thioredoxin family protein [Chloroflexi bacterium]|nr:MAG: thioredoxin family protein [Chloroflexota bacterium]